MAQLTYHVATTLDLFIADPNGVADESVFLYADDGGDFFESVRNYDAVLMGSRTYAYGFRYGLKPGEPSGIAQAVHPDLKHYIFSRGLDFESNEKVELVREDAAAFTRRLKNEGKYQNLWLCGGGLLAGELLRHQLIDTLILKINPVLLGDGIPLFGPVKQKLNLKLLSSKTYDSGVVLSSYQIIYPS
ncbi:Riboflavin biosynthesis protein RibD C-terminal domain protein, Dihydrofolate reductase [Thermobacillus xylanilyticus]|jgi:dihydrofolate reductase|uniref:Dihydrofolate reductase n=2 Tax=Thermobacillus TaxID=76632 RepID=L0EII6_THECK|nr:MULTISPECIES: dihydrofolate reductase family protein [Thermobacillus]AGA58960.1 dihydrofolate reductase [Thermobacillus composti KWC4]REJ20040.1 MAG: deaminase [Paenibacillaceae bacterium]CAG5081434.1 Riboflavin biosynthesis protein RibD C-terminal domain protein, Dihydrofolate reductase [Thermobacillus xylanilyticus]